MNYQFINTEYLDSVSGGDPELTNEIVSIFKEQVAEAYHEMKELLDSGNYHNLGLLAHKIKSSVSIMGMNELASILKTFELETREEKNSEKYGSYIERFKNDTGNAVKELDDHLKKISG
jgi:HPt (histidine-containing phosphotransfer) domain-containing protein